MRISIFLAMVCFAVDVAYAYLTQSFLKGLVIAVYSHIWESILVNALFLGLLLFLGLGFAVFIEIIGFLLLIGAFDD